MNEIDAVICPVLPTCASVSGCGAKATVWLVCRDLEVGDVAVGGSHYCAEHGESVCRALASEESEGWRLVPITTGAP